MQPPLQFKVQSKLFNVRFAVRFANRLKPGQKGKRRDIFVQAGF
jgi:hypothetical protein